ncbi:MAG TPA: hypothetical protein VLQ78_09270 [Ornithinibacter sp.]|nr:hypothetical protein [Ornithinibacter sp.]
MPWDDSRMPPRLLSPDVTAAPVEHAPMPAAEVFVVLAGRGGATFPDGERIDPAPGVAVALRAGERTVWVVTERLRKIWVA